MRHIPPHHPRGMALVMAMIVVVLITLLVAGAISFTGTERAAAEVQTQEAEMSACVQAARNLFLSKVRRELADPSPNNPKLDIQFDEQLGYDDPNDPYKKRPVVLRTAHLGGDVAIKSADRVESMRDPLAGTDDITSQTGGKQPPLFYTVTAVCRESADPSSPEREIEFMVRVGF